MRPSSSSVASPTSATDATEIVQDCVQLHGGIGVTWEHDLHLYLRRVTLDRDLYGTPARAPRAPRRDDPHRRAGARRCLTHPAPRWRASSRSGCGRGRGWPRTCPACSRVRRPSTGPKTTRSWVRDRELQRMLCDGGFAGICFPTEYGGLGLTPSTSRRSRRSRCRLRDAAAAQRAHVSHPAPPTLLDFGTEEQKRRAPAGDPPGDEIWVQFLSEPTRRLGPGRRVTTRATRDGDVFDPQRLEDLELRRLRRRTTALCLARTDWDVPKHRGLTMFIVKIHQPGIDVEPIKQVNGSQRVLPGVLRRRAGPGRQRGRRRQRRLDGRQPPAAVHERNAVGGGSPYVSGRNYLAEGADGAATRPHLAGHCAGNRH